MTRTISQSIANRLDAIANTDAESARAIDAMFDAFSQFDTPQHGALHAWLTGAFSDAMSAVLCAAWLDGWQCGRNPDRLVFSDGSLRHPDPDVEV